MLLLRTAKGFHSQRSEYIEAGGALCLSKAYTTIVLMEIGSPADCHSTRYSLMTLYSTAEDKLINGNTVKSIIPSEFRALRNTLISVYQID